MGHTLTGRLAGQNAGNARAILVVVATAVVGAVAAGLQMAGVASGEVAATVLFLPVFAAALLGGRTAGFVTAAVATALYVAIRRSDLEAAGAASAAVLAATRGGAYLVAAHVGALTRGVTSYLGEEPAGARVGSSLPNGARRRAGPTGAPPWAATDGRSRSRRTGGADGGGQPMSTANAWPDPQGTPGEPGAWPATEATPLEDDSWEAVQQSWRRQHGVPAEHEPARPPRHEHDGWPHEPAAADPWAEPAAPLGHAPRPDEGWPGDNGHAGSWDGAGSDGWHPGEAQRAGPPPAPGSPAVPTDMWGQPLTTVSPTAAPGWQPPAPAAPGPWGQEPGPAAWGDPPAGGGWEHQGAAPPAGAWGDPQASAGWNDQPPAGGGWEQQGAAPPAGAWGDPPPAGSGPGQADWGDPPAVQGWDQPGPAPAAWDGRPDPGAWNQPAPADAPGWTEQAPQWPGSPAGDHWPGAPSPAWADPAGPAGPAGPAPESWPAPPPAEGWPQPPQAPAHTGADPWSAPPPAEGWPDAQPATGEAGAALWPSPPAADGWQGVEPDPGFGPPPSDAWSAAPSAPAVAGAPAGRNGAPAGADSGPPAPLPAVDPETGLWTAKFLRDRLSAEQSRSRRSHRPFSLVLVQVPDAPLAALPYRRQLTLLRELGYQFVAGGVVDHLVHVPDREQHWFAVILPDTDRSGAQVIERRLRLGIGGYLSSRGMRLRELQSASLTAPDDDPQMGAIWDALIGPDDAGDAAPMAVDH